MVKQTAPTKGKERVITIQPPSGPRPSKIKRYVESTGGPVSITVKPKTTVDKQKSMTVKKRGRPPKKVEASSSSSSSPPTDQPKPKPKPKALTGDIKKKWVNFAKKFKKEMKNKGDTDEEITTFAKYYHDLILNSSDQEKTLEEIIQGHTTDDAFIPLYNPQQDQPMEDIVEDKPEQFDVKKV